MTLVSGTNTMVLGIGEQLHDGGGGQWVFANGTTVQLQQSRWLGNGTQWIRDLETADAAAIIISAITTTEILTTAIPTGAETILPGRWRRTDNSQAEDQNVDSQDDSNAPDDNSPDDNATPGIMAPSDNNNNAPDTDADTQDNTTTQQNDQSPDDSGDSERPARSIKGGDAQPNYNR